MEGYFNACLDLPQRQRELKGGALGWGGVLNVNQAKHGKEYNCIAEIVLPVTNTTVQCHTKLSNFTLNEDTTSIIAKLNESQHWFGKLDRKLLKYMMPNMDILT